MNEWVTGSLRRKQAIFLVGIVLFAQGAQASAGDAFDTQLNRIQQRWAEVNYNESGKAQKAAFDALLEDVRALESGNPDRAEAKVWHGIVASTYAGVKGPFGAMSLANEAKAALEAAEALDPSVLDGSVYSSLGALYYKVPGGLIGFGDVDKARAYLEKALQASPEGIDSNYFYGEFLFEQDEFEAARQALTRAIQAPPRPERALADQGRHKEINDLLERVNARLERRS